MRNLSLLVGTTLALSACTGTTPPEQNAAELTRLQYTQQCDAKLPFFGYYRYSRDEREQYVAPDGRIAMANDGGWCAIRYQVVSPNGGFAVSEAEVLSAPAHGSVAVGTLNGLLRIAYRPAANFAGDDMFEVRLRGPIPYTIPVRVSVARGGTVGS